MTDLEIAVQNLDGHSICLCKNGELIINDGRGISPMMQLIAGNKDLNGYSAADIIVGKATAILFVKAGITCVHGRTMSESGRAYLESHGIPCTYDILTERIINRKGTDICPMEKAVADIEDTETGYEALRKRVEEMRTERTE